MLSTRLFAPWVLSPSLIPTLLNPPVLVTYFSPLYLFSPSGFHIHVPPLYHPPFLSLCFFFFFHCCSPASSLFHWNLLYSYWSARCILARVGFTHWLEKHLASGSVRVNAHTHTRALCLPAIALLGLEDDIALRFISGEIFHCCFRQTAAQFKQPHYRNWSDKWKVSWDSSVVLAFT